MRHHFTLAWHYSTVFFTLAKHCCNFEPLLIHWIHPLPHCQPNWQLQKTCSYFHAQVVCPLHHHGVPTWQRHETDFHHKIVLHCAVSTSIVPTFTNLQLIICPIIDIQYCGSSPQYIYIHTGLQKYWPDWANINLWHFDL